MEVVKSLIEKNEQHLTHSGAGVFEMLSHAIERDLGGFIGGIPVGARANCRKADGGRAALFRQFQTCAIATGQLRRFVVQAILIDRADCVDHILRRKRAGRSYDSASRWETAGVAADFIQPANIGWSTAP